MEPLAALREVRWGAASFPLDALVSSYRLPQVVRLDSGESIEGLRENDYLLIHSCRQWTTITAHSLEEGHYVIGPKIEIPVHYGGQFKLLEQDRDIKEPVQYFNSVEEVAKAFPERVYVMEEITFNVKVASGECNEDTEVYNITLCTGDELTLMGQAEILYAKTSKEKSRLNTIFKKIGKLNSISKLGKGKMPCLICMNHRTNESISLPFQCKGRFSTRSPLEIQMQEGEHTIRNIVEKTRLPVNVTVPSPPPRNSYDLHFIREGHRYKLVNIQTKTVVVCCVLRANKIIPMHFPLHLSVPKFSLPESLVKGEMWHDSLAQQWYGICQEQFDIDEYSRAVRDVKTDWNEESKSPKKSRCTGHNHIPNSLSYARDELTQSFHRLSVCVYGNNLHGNSEVNLHGCRDLCSDWTMFPRDSPQYLDSGDSGSDYLFPEVTEEPTCAPTKTEIPYEELWLDQESGKHSSQPLTRSQSEKSKCDHYRSSLRSKCGTSPLPAPGTLTAAKSTESSLPPPPVPPKSEAVREECRLLNAPPVPPRSSKPASTSPSVPARTAKPVRQQTRSPSPTLSYYSSGLHSIGITESEMSHSSENMPVSCYPCNWMKTDSTDPNSKSPFGSPSSEVLPNRLSWPNRFCSGTEGLNVNDLLLDQCRSYYSYPRQKTPGTPKKNVPTPFDLSGCEVSTGSIQPTTTEFKSINTSCPKSASYSLESSSERILADSSTKQSQSCPALPPRAPKSNDEKPVLELLPLPLRIDGAEELQTPISDLSEDYFARKGMQDIFSISYPFASPLHLQLAPRSCGDGSPWQPPSDLSGLSIEEVSKSLRFIGLSEDVVTLFVNEKIDGNLLVQLTEEILSEDFKMSKLQVKKILQFINGWRPKM
ncbi:GRB2-associated and regulator of MAPK protein 1 isoform X2 [Rhinatrema bivittatum]|uniref:GRB2-associated and regulator of MAPK protein 1 isoform X2 n=1 Tax=Rhinatrema bivittatum TaxID=194408 RepID=UPI00112B1E8B|nr:GRB2-associated and regulator of MAPK protein 1 isoform X2 [Rhinatrema bivittatum]